MCDFSGKLIAWMDRELPAEESAEVEKHLEGCSECRSRLDAFKRVSIGIEVYCDETVASSAPHGIPLLAPAISAATAVAIVLVLFLAWPKTRVEPPAAYSSQAAVTAPPAHIAETSPAPVHRIEHLRRRQGVEPARDFAQGQEKATASAPRQTKLADVVPEESIIRIAIPAEEMFPPGAVPEGMNFIADVTIAPDGSAERMRLRPQLAAFERSTTQP